MNHIGQAFVREIGIDRLRAVTEQKAKMMHFPRFSRLEHQSYARACASADQMMMQPCGREQCRDGRMGSIDFSIRQDQNRRSFADGLIRGLEKRIQGALQTGLTFVRIEENWQRLGLDSRLIDGSELCHFGILQYRLRQSELSATLRVGIDEITFAAKRECRRGNEFFTNWINGWIGDLRKQLLEVVVKQLGFI